MARPLTGQVDKLPSGRFEASLPESNGSRIRRREYFDTRQEADDWRWLAVACVNRGEPVPSPVPSAGWLEDLATMASPCVLRRAASSRRVATRSCARSRRKSGSRSGSEL